MLKSDRLASVIRVYLDGELELGTAVAELVFVFLERGWRFSLIEADCDPRHRERIRALAVRFDGAVMARRDSAGRGLNQAPPIVIR